MGEVTERYITAVITRVRDGEGETSPSERQAAFNDASLLPGGARALLEKVTQNAYKITDADIAGAKAAGLSEDQLFELCIAAAMGQATRQREAGRAAIERANKEMP